MYIIDVSNLLSDYCERTTEVFEGSKTLLFQVGEHLRLTIILYKDEVPYFLLSRKDGQPVERLAYFYLLEYWTFIFPGIRLPERVDQYYNEETGVLHIREKVNLYKERY